MSKIIVEMPEGFEELAPEYLVRRRDELPKLRSLAAEGDFAAIERIGHNLKGTGTAYGFEAITEIGAALEEAAEQADRGRLRAALENLANYLELVELR